MKFTISINCLRDFLNLFEKYNSINSEEKFSFQIVLPNQKEADFWAKS